LDVDSVGIETGNILVDDGSTLLEVSATSYQDVNNFWTFLAANKTINPFDLLAPNASTFIDDNNYKINLILFSSPGATTGGTAFPIGSIITPSTSNAGATYNYGSTGNFSLNGPFTIIQDSSFYDANIVIGDQVGGTGDFITVGGPSETVTVLKLIDGGTYSWAGQYYTGNKKYYTDKVVSLSLDKDAKIINRESTVGNTTIDQLLPYSTPIDGITTPTQSTVSNQINNKYKNIQAYIKNNLGLIQSSFKTAKYN
jgi:hypothetical protein